MSKGNGKDVYHGSNYGPCFLCDGIELSKTMNSDNGGLCYTNVNSNSHLKDSEGKSILTGEYKSDGMAEFTCVECEVYQVFKWTSLFHFHHI